MVVVGILLLFAATSASAADRERLSILFLGDNGHHRPADRAAQLVPVLAERGIDVKYTDDIGVLVLDTLNQFDGLIIYANIDEITPEHEAALIEYVQSGRGFIPLHCASYCFLNSDAYVKLVGAQFQRHGTGEFRTEIADPDHPVMRGFGGFESWDETYVHTRHNAENRTVLEYRTGGEQAEGNEREPWTWVRTQGDGRVFYTAWGHDQRTWGHPAFHNLVERGIRWACGDDPTVVPKYREREPFSVPEMTAMREDVAAFEYVDVGDEIPNYTSGAKWGTQGEPISKMQRPLSAEESLKHYVTPVGFELRLFASEQPTENLEASPAYAGLGGKPIAMNWDERGRLWVCETYDYPNELQPLGEGRDRIRICEDTDRDGRADKFTVFAEKLSIPTAITFAYGGAVVQNGTETLFLKDTDGDDKADVREVLISGWALGDTHGGVSNFQYGLDNWIYAMQGYNYSEPVINGEKQPGFRMGFFRFRLDPPANGTPAAFPTVAQIEFLRSTNNNTWGLGISEEGIIFGSTANHNPSVYMPIPNRYYERVRGWAPEQLGAIADTYLFDPVTDKVRQVDQHGGYTAGAGHALYTAREYPAQYWNRTAFVCGPTGHLVGTFVLEANGSGFSSTSPCNLVASDDEWSAPIMAEVGPDGNVWILDWYNYIVQHNPTPQGFETGKGNAYESDLRDKTHGRIYRLVYVGGREQGTGNSEPAARNHRTTTSPDLSSASSDELVAALRHPTFLVRRQAQRLLVERGETDVFPAMIELIEDESVDDIGLNVGAIHALWTLKGIGAFESDKQRAHELLARMLRHSSVGVRRNAIQVLPFTPQSVELLVASSVRHDDDAQVQLAYLLALSDMPDTESIGSLVGDPVMDDAIMTDRWLQDAATSAACVHATAFFAHLVTLHENPGAPGTSADAPVWSVVRRAAEHIARGRPAAEEMNRLAALLGRGSELFVENATAGLVAGWPKDHRVQLAGEAEQSLLGLLDRLTPAGKGQLVRLASLLGARGLDAHIVEITSALLTSVADEETELSIRLEAARQLVGFQPQNGDVASELLDLLTPASPPEFSVGVIEALSASTATNVGPELIERSPHWTPAARDAAVRVLLGRPETTIALLDAVEAGEASLADLKLDQKQALSTHPDEKLRERAVALLRVGGGLPDPDRQKVLEELLPLAQRTGDAALGKEVYKKQCSKCHVHGSEGTRIGPDLTGMAVHPKAELLTNIIDPSRSVEGNFRIYTVLTNDGIVINGMLAAETRTTLELIDTEAKRHVVQRDEIDELLASPKSLMPEGFEKQASQDDIANLLEFLTQRGKYLPIPLDKAATVVSTKDMFFDRGGTVERMIFSDWGPKEFKGVPFTLVDPLGERRPNVVMLRGPNGVIPPRMPESVTLPCSAPAKAIHFLSGVGGWSFPAHRAETVSLIVRLHYADEQTEDHELMNGVHFADYIRRVDVPGSEFAFALRNQQLRYFAIEPKREEAIQKIELIKGDDPTAPVVMAVTVESP